MSTAIQHFDDIRKNFLIEKPLVCFRNKPGLWPLYRGFFVDLNLFKENREKVAQTAKNTNDLLKHVNSSNGTLAKDDLVDEDAN
ncbi:tRNA ligase 1 [Camellia lanceoleosa]|uniref:tRNA ligase 1 n=1 Tax=Camellia lanceoleosa TaxID=1840588 RepID=A0ACC0IY10_9ERIC|nr:tRNA ligase 1 [Camellia lanceoleosa]